jgi:hypothetical protein
MGVTHVVSFMACPKVLGQSAQAVRGLEIGSNPIGHRGAG